MSTRPEIQIDIPRDLPAGAEFTFVNTGPEPVYVQMVGTVEPGDEAVYRERPADIDLFFGLTYSNYLVLHRSIMQSMPLDWQHRFTRLMDEVQDRIEPPMQELMPSYYDIRILARAPERVPPDCEKCCGRGTLRSAYGGEVDCADCNGSGKDYDGDYEYETPEQVGIIDDPIPHYNRTRTVIDFTTGLEARYCPLCQTHKPANHTH